MRQTSKLQSINNLISEDELIQSIQDARLEHKNGQTIKADSISDLLNKIQCQKQ